MPSAISFRALFIFIRLYSCPKKFRFGVYRTFPVFGSKLVITPFAGFPTILKVKVSPSASAPVRVKSIATSSLVVKFKLFAVGAVSQQLRHLKFSRRLKNI